MADKERGVTIRAAIFDFDETIIDLQVHHLAAERATLVALGRDWDELPESFWRGQSGRRHSDIWEDIRAHLALTEPLPNLLAARQVHFLAALRNADALPALPGAVEAVKRLHAAGYPLAVTTSGIREYVDLVLARMGIADRFAVTVTGADVTRGKPDPEPYRVTAARLGVPPPECIVFEDAAIGVAAAKAAGMRCIGVPNPYALFAQDLSAADRVLPSLRDFSPALLAQW